MDLDFRGQVVLVTGASRGIGRATAVEFASCGARVAVHYHHDEAAAQETRALLAGDGHLVLAADLTRADETGRLVNDVVNATGRLDVVVNNAGRYERHAVLEAGFDEWCDAWNRTLALNLLGPAHTTYHAARHMAAAGGGCIVNVSSRGAYRGEPDHPAYGASKAAVNAMGQSLARALGPHGVRVVTVAPGFVDTEMAAPYLAGSEGDEIRAQSPLGRVARPHEVAAAIVFLASHAADYASGAVLDLFGASYFRA